MENKCIHTFHKCISVIWTVHTHTHTHTHTHIYIYIYTYMYVCMYVYRLTFVVPQYHNFSVWLDTRDASSWNRNPTDFWSVGHLTPNIIIIKSRCQQGFFCLSLCLSLAIRPNHSSIVCTEQLLVSYYWSTNTSTSVWRGTKENVA